MGFRIPGRMITLNKYWLLLPLGVFLFWLAVHLGEDDGGGMLSGFMTLVYLLLALCLFLLVLSAMLLYDFHRHV